ncbi:histidine protein methyltransferase 1 homolog [Gordionus sp. m RMFG-2023]|uniref:histidine protein methyltransferase 1 homolog n=1 Tax=Gordionus sp. m RMFG-2023 TaxID=3053472 RepID=UPI0031FC03FC
MYGPFDENILKSSLYHINNLRYLTNSYKFDTLPQQSDLVPNEYEGGFKIWECTEDLLIYSGKLDFKNKSVLDLGCGSGLLGINALMEGAKNICFQDFNHDVMLNFTIPNVWINFFNLYNNVDFANPDFILNEMNDRCNFVYGDWGQIIHMDLIPMKYDYILTSETIYNLDNFTKLHDMFKHYIKSDGKIYIAAKSHYFGVGGSVHLFLKMLTEFKLNKKNNFIYNICYNNDEGIVPRQIIELSIPSIE